MKGKGKLIESPIIGEDFTGYSVHSDESGWLISLTDFMTDWIRRYGVTPKLPKKGGFVTEKAGSPRQPSADSTYEICARIAEDYYKTQDVPGSVKAIIGREIALAIRAAELREANCEKRGRKA